jgi:imidazolonepropionase-like amidohydrolase
MTDGMQTLIQNLNIVDVVSRRVIPSASLLIKDGAIANIGQLDTIRKGWVLDADDCWAIPSYIDMHVHTTFEERGHHLAAFHFDEPQNISIVRGAQNLLEALRCGVCLVRDMGSKGRRAALLKDLVDTGAILGPEMVLSGEPLCVEGGHGAEFGQVLSNRDIASLLDSHLAEGYEWLKIMNGPELFDEHLLGNIVDASHRLGVKVAIHAFTEPGIRSAIEAGADTIEHAVVFDDHLVRIAIKNGTQFVPTYYCAWISLSEDYISTVDDSAYIASLEEWYGFLKAHFSYHINNRLPVLAGTDAGSAPSTFSDMTCELRMLNHCGLSTLDTIRSATILSAQALGREEKYGSIDIGKWANLILLEDNPLEDMNALEEVMAIWYKGIIIFSRIGMPWS